MFGTVARMRVKPGKLADLKALMDNDEPRGVDGYVSTVFYQSSDDPDEIWLAVVFRDRASYNANADSPDQAEMYGKMRALLAADPEWHDGEVLFATETPAAAAM